MRRRQEKKELLWNIAVEKKFQATNVHQQSDKKKIFEWLIKIKIELDKYR